MKNLLVKSIAVRNLFSFIVVMMGFLLLIPSVWAITTTSTVTSEECYKSNSYDWIFLYWMPYDNDLSPFAKPILEMITKGVQSQNVLVVVEYDLTGKQQLSRQVISKDKVCTQTLNATNSASEEVFAEYLHWANSQFQAKKWAIVFLGHGGSLDEVSPDEHPETHTVNIQWMNINQLSKTVTQFNEQIQDQVELFFFQNCNKGTIEVHYTFRNVARYTLSSQTLLGAPNYYYESLFRFLGNYPKVNGEQVAKKIQEFERSDMYYSYTVTDNSRFSQISETMNQLIDSSLSSNRRKIMNSNQIPKYNYAGEYYVDIIELFYTLPAYIKNPPNRFEAFMESFHRSVIHLKNPDEIPKNLSGLGLFLPFNREHLEKYRYLQVYSDFKLIELFGAILESF